MSKKGVYITVGSILLVLIVVVVLIVTREKSEFPLKRGSKGSNVTKWQTYLQTINPAIVADGVFGPKTEAATILAIGTTTVSKKDFKANT